MTEPLWTDSEWTFDRLHRTYDEIEKIGLGELDLNIYRNQIDIIGSEQMLDAYTSVGMPIYYKHWSFGKSFVAQQDDYKSGRSGLAYEIVINSNPCINYLMEENSMTVQALVMAHAAFGHNHFFKNNYLFKQWTDADAIVDYLVFAREYILKAEQREGREVVEAFLDSCHALMNYGVNRYKHPAKLSLVKEEQRELEREEHTRSQINELYRLYPVEAPKSKEKKLFPAEPEENILYFCEKHAPNLKTWQREIIRIVRKIAQYFYPQGQTKVANEGFASWTHHTIMNRLHDKGLTTAGAHIEFLALHTAVLNQYSFSQMNPYKLGFEILKDIERICDNPTDEDRRWFPQIVGEKSIDVIKDAVANYRDESLLLQFLSPKLIRDFRFFRLHDKRDTDHYLVTAIHDDRGYQDVREGLAQMHEREVNIPRIEVTKADPDTRVLSLQYTPLRGRQLGGTGAMMKHLRVLWTQPVNLYDDKGFLLAAA